MWSTLLYAVPALWRRNAELWPPKLWPTKLLPTTDEWITSMRTFLRTILRTLRAHGTNLLTVLTHVTYERVLVTVRAVRSLWTVWSVWPVRAMWSLRPVRTLRTLRPAVRRRRALRVNHALPAVRTVRPMWPMWSVWALWPLRAMRSDYVLSVLGLLYVDVILIISNKPVQSNKNSLPPTFQFRTRCKRDGKAMGPPGSQVGRMVRLATHCVCVYCLYFKNSTSQPGPVVQHHDAEKRKNGTLSGTTRCLRRMNGACASPNQSLKK
ncbi:uncharacterized protein [Atheta coriaria]|uniref:uncharacterized protein isoform X3 n=1 Tax=Dalotia coriaria TaxID=877792 RepID=UPI0031F3984F